MKHNPTQSAETIMREVDEAGDPKNMTRDEWIEFLSTIITDCESRLEAAEEEKEAARK